MFLDRVVLFFSMMGCKKKFEEKLSNEKEKKKQKVSKMKASLN